MSHGSVRPDLGDRDAAAPQLGRHGGQQHVEQAGPVHHHDRPEPLDHVVGVGLGQPAAASRPDPRLAFEDRQFADLVAEP
ncbi:MAG TPA: hypothetical protein VGM14_12530 [Streptosporangiaceae bacterium]